MWEIKQAVRNKEWMQAYRDRIDQKWVNDELLSWVSDQEWSYFVTVSPRRDLSLQAAPRVLFHFLAEYTYSWTPQVVLWVSEPFRTRNGAHVHMLWQYEQGKRDPREWKKINEWGWLKIGITRAFPFDKERGAAPYLFKYIFKQHNEDNWGLWTL